MAKVVKSTREVVDVNKEIEKVTSSKKTKTSSKKNEDKKKSVKKKTSNKKNKSSFLKEVREEVSKVKWPSRKEMVKYSAATIYFILFFGVFFYIITAIMVMIKELV